MYSVSVLWTGYRVSVSFQPFIPICCPSHKGPLQRKQMRRSHNDDAWNIIHLVWRILETRFMDGLGRIHCVNGTCRMHHRMVRNAVGHFEGTTSSYSQRNIHWCYDHVSGDDHMDTTTYCRRVHVQS